MSAATFGPADVILEEFRSRWPAAYRCHPADPGRWLGACPECQAALVILEHRRGRPVTLHCAGGCAEREILGALDRATGGPYHVAELAAQRIMVETDVERARRARQAQREAASWR